MNRVSDFSLRRITVAIVFLCLTVLTVCQILGPAAQLNIAFAPPDLSKQTQVAATIQTAGGQSSQSLRCASVPLVSPEVESANLEQELVACNLTTALHSIPPHIAELGVPTPPPRFA